MNYEPIASASDAQGEPPNKAVKLGETIFANNRPFVLIAGPCALESRAHTFEVATEIKRITQDLGLGFVFKASFDKANRTSLKSSRGVGLHAAIDIFGELREALDIHITTDVHAESHCELVARVVDVIQIPAFLCRQTDLLRAAANTNRVVNIKKGQFLAPWDMAHAVKKVVASGNRNVLVTERGTTFGYNALVSDMRSLAIMAEQIEVPVVFDATHSVQEPGGRGSASGGQRRFVGVLASAAVAVGIAALFVETHQDPDTAPSDGATMVPLKDLPTMLRKLRALDRVVKGS